MPKTTITEAYEMIRREAPETVNYGVFNTVPGALKVEISINGNIWVETRRESFWLSPSQLIRVVDFM